MIIAARRKSKALCQRDGKFRRVATALSGDALSSVRMALAAGQPSARQ